ncbi:hypothetical protein DPMN_084114 [Dreissena polymorpha]|uniref:Uncharacterized protein n=1 Tax=Dreissena polymorpha TaxID=45954 RepID=A0A9D4BKJ5_DREPO|nr:hypothetical protein DPMN_084114 [Dreissena polymorpha]
MIRSSSCQYFDRGCLQDTLCCSFFWEQLQESLLLFHSSFERRIFRDMGTKSCDARFNIKVNQQYCVLIFKLAVELALGILGGTECCAEAEIPDSDTNAILCDVLNTLNLQKICRCNELDLEPLKFIILRNQKGTPNWLRATQLVAGEINKTNVLTNFHDDWAKIVTSRVFTRKTAPPTGGHIFQRTGTTFELNQHIIKTNILTKLHEDWALNVTSTVFELYRDFIGTKLLTKFHEVRTINVASRELTNKC